MSAVGEANYLDYVDAKVEQMHTQPAGSLARREKLTKVVEIAVEPRDAVTEEGDRVVSFEWCACRRELGDVCRVGVGVNPR